MAIQSNTINFKTKGKQKANDCKLWVEKKCGSIGFRTEVLTVGHCLFGWMMAPQDIQHSIYLSLQQRKGKGLCARRTWDF